MIRLRIRHADYSFLGIIISADSILEDFGFENDYVDSQSWFFTDVAMLAVFDPERLRHRADAESDWWCSDLLQLEEFDPAQLALAGLGGDGTYQRASQMAT